MVDICLELEDSLIARLSAQANELDLDLEDYIRKIIEECASTVDLPDMPLGPLHDEPVVKAAEIENFYRKHDFGFGWRFITSPLANAATAKLLLVTLNPAGREEHGPAFSQEEGSAYRVESWGSRPPGTAPLQRQIQLLFEFLGLEDEQVFSAHYVPFRSPSWRELPNKREAEQLAHNLWSWLKGFVAFEQIVCIGKDRPAKPITEIFEALLEGSFPVGWGNVTADRYRLKDNRTLIALPHLSRFTLFGRPEANSHLRALFDV